MNREFVTYEQALALKELGFNESCFGKYDIYGSFDHKLFYYNHDSETSLNCSAPTFSQAFRWLREKYGLFSEIQPYLIIGTQWRYTITNRNNSSGLPHEEGFETYEEAEQACLEKLIEIIKKDAHI